jgi:hypothetical protein
LNSMHKIFASLSSPPSKLHKVKAVYGW